MNLSIRDVLALPELTALRLRAGEAGTQRPVRWPYVAESDSIAEWLRGGELVFVTGINQTRSEGNLLQLICEAHKHHCAGVVILTGPRYIQYIPAGALIEADKLGMPLIEQPYDLPLTVVTEAIGSALVQGQLICKSRQQFVEQLLDGNLADPDVVAHYATNLAIDLRRARQVLVLRLHKGVVLDGASDAAHAGQQLHTFRERLMQQLVGCLNTLGDPLPVVIQAEQWIALLPADAGDAPLRNRSAIEQLLQSLNEDPAIFQVFAGLSVVCLQPGDLPRGLGQARQALIAAQSLPERPGLCCFEELGMVELLLAVRDRNLLDRLVTNTLGPLLHHDKAHPPVLVETLEAWIQSNGNLVAAAECLGVHRNTLSHRMRQISTLTGLDLNNAHHRLNISVALMIWRLALHTP